RADRGRVLARCRLRHHSRSRVRADPRVALGEPSMDLFDSIEVYAAAASGSSDEAAKPHEFGAGLTIGAIIVPGHQTHEGVLIRAVALPWHKIVESVVRDPAMIHQMDWRQWEEIIAGAYRERGYDVVLTPRSDDKGRDIIATIGDHGSIRILDQVK